MSGCAVHAALGESNVVAHVTGRRVRCVQNRIERDHEAYKRRNLIEPCVNSLEQFRRIATRYEKTARAYLSKLCIAAARLWTKTINAA
jgi:transposase